jgi:DNA-binding response OmpR family regulator
MNDDPNKLEKIPRALLVYLRENQGRIVSREELLERVWHVRFTPHTRTVDQNVAKVRKALPKGEAVQTVYGLGYCYLSSAREGKATRRSDWRPRESNSRNE